MEDEENFLLLNISIFSPLLKVHPLRISFNFWRFSLGKNGSIRPSLNRKSWIREARVIHSRGIFQTLNQNFLRFGIKDPCKLGNVNSIKGRDSFSRKFPQRKISVRGESSSCYARPVSRMDNGEPVEREQRRVEGGGELVGNFFFFFFFRDDKRGTNRSINWTDAAECNCRPFRFETCGLPHEGEPSFLTITDHWNVDSKGSPFYDRSRTIVYSCHVFAVFHLCLD